MNELTLYSISHYTFLNKLSFLRLRLFFNIPSGAILLIEDIDAMNNLPSRNEKEEDTDETREPPKSKISLSILLNLLDGACKADKVITIITTNFKENINSALLREGRINYEFFLDEVDEYQIEHLLKYYLQLDNNEYHALCSDQELFTKLSNITPAKLVNDIRKSFVKTSSQILNLAQEINTRKLTWYEKTLLFKNIF
jgi:SpoVK/Ycf46/Vps4 family AAA+-type ATPase